MADAEIVSLRAKLASRPRSDDYRQRRRDFDARSLEYGVASDVTVEPVTANGVRAEWTSTPQDGSDAALLYLHGVVRLTYRVRRSPTQDARSHCRHRIPPFARRFGSKDPQR
jgi:hypothetical protein